MRDSAVSAEVADTGLGVLAVQIVKDRVNLTIDHGAVVILHIRNQIPQIAVSGLLLRRGYYNQLFLRSGYRHIQEIRLVGKLAHLTVHGGENDGVLFPSLKLVDGVCLKVQLLTVQSFDLIAIGRNHTHIALAGQLWKNLLPDDVDFPLIGLIALVSSGSRAVEQKGVLLPVILCHNDELIMIELLVAKTDDFWVTAVVLTKQGLRRIGQGGAEGFQQAVCIAVIERL